MGYSRLFGQNGEWEFAIKPDVLLPTLDELYTVSVGISDEEDPAAAAHRVRLALKVYATSLLKPLGQSVEILDGESDVAVAFAQRVGFFASVI